MEAMFKFRGKESDLRKLISIFEAILGSEPFEDIEGEILCRKLEPYTI